MGNALKAGDGQKFNLDDLNAHNIAEHDVSLSRKDAFTGDSLRFDQSVWDETLLFFPGNTISIEQAALARLDRLMISRKNNPQFNLTTGGMGASVSEACFFLILFGDRVNGNANKQFTRILFGKICHPF
jgi:hypothetical protein